jgi:hypothetical protein
MAVLVRAFSIAHTLGGFEPTSRRHDFPKNNFSQNGILQNVVPVQVFRIIYLNELFLQAIGKKRIFLDIRT